MEYGIWNMGNRECNEGIADLGFLISEILEIPVFTKNSRLQFRNPTSDTRNRWVIVFLCTLLIPSRKYYCYFRFMEYPQMLFEN
jgi:hypothetical protein